MSTRLSYILAAAVGLCVLAYTAPNLETAVLHSGTFRVTGDGALSILDVHTGESLSVVYRDSQGRYDLSSLEAVDRLLRCHGDGLEHPISLKLIELVDHLQDRFGAAEVRMVSGYRSPDYNASLKKRLGRVAHDSLHMQGMAMDIQIAGIGKGELGAYARSVEGGGVGVYRSSSYIHVDVGPVRSW